MAVELITNGSFENQQNNVPTAWTTTGPGRFNNWDYRPDGAAMYGFSVGSPNHSGTIQQTIATVPGKIYTISFKTGISWQAPNADVNVDAKIKVDALAGATLIESETINLPFRKIAGWGTYSFTFTATSDQTTLKFTDTSPNGQPDFDVGLDTVSVQEAPSRAQVGEWGNLLDWPLIGLHAVVTQDGKVLTFGTTGITNPDGSTFQSAMTHDLWDPVTGQHQLLDLTHTSGSDVFCSAAIILPGTNRVLIGGGDQPQAGNQSSNDSTEFDLSTHAMTLSPEGGMNVPRWYPTMVSLPTGQVVIMGGTGSGGVTEIFTDGEGWRKLTGVPTDALGESYYPRAWVGGDGNIILFTPGSTELRVLDPSGNGSIHTIGTLPFSTSWESPAIMYDAGKTLIMASNGDLWTMDISGPTPTFFKVGSTGQNATGRT